MPKAADPPTVLAWVESPFQLLGALEAFSSGLLGGRLVVLPRRGVEPLVDTVAELQRLGLPAGVTLLAPGPAPHRYHGMLAVGDAFSGEAHRLILQSSPRQVILLDDGRSTKRVMSALTEPGLALVRPHITPSLARSLLAAMALQKLKRLAGQHRLQVITALQLPESLLAAARERGIRVDRHTFEWLRGLPDDDIDDLEGDGSTETVVLGTSLVANDLIVARPYLDWIRAVARTTSLSYRPHRREDARTLAEVARFPGVVVQPGQVPVELSLRAMTARHRVLTLPTTAASSLRLITPEARIQEFAVPDRWWLPDVPMAVRLHLVPEYEDQAPISPGVPSARPGNDRVAR
jgi:hypothetical protein